MGLGLKLISLIFFSLFLLNPKIKNHVKLFRLSRGYATSFILEGVAKQCIDAFNGRIEDCPSPFLQFVKIHVKTLLSRLPYIVFNWVRRMQIQFRTPWPNLLLAIVVFPIVNLTPSLPW